MRNYQIKKNNPYWMPHNLYMRTLYLVKDYDRLVDDYHELIYLSSKSDGQPKGSMLGDPTANTAIRLDKLSSELKAVEQATILLPEEYRYGILNNIKHGIRYPITAHLNTWKTWKARFVYNIAKNLNEI